MKFILSLLLLVNTSWASEQMPSYLKDATIIVTLKNGKNYNFNISKWKVVPRDSECPKVKETVELMHQYSSTVYRPNRFSLIGGYGKNGKLTTSIQGSNVLISPSNGFLFGVQYQRNIYDRFSLGLQFLNNSSYLGTIGIDF